MAGGTFQQMNKVRPGAYINFMQEPIDDYNFYGTRGIVTMPMALKWGAEDKIITVTASDMTSGDSLKKVGFVYTDDASLLPNLALEHAEVLKLYNTNVGMVKASKVIGNVDEGTTTTDGVKIEAKYGGTFGNKIAIVIRSEDSKFVVETYADGYFVDRQKVSGIAELQANDFVTFTALDENAELVVTTSTLLVGGTDGTAQTAATYLPLYFNKLTTEAFDTMAFTGTTATDQKLVYDFIVSQRENEGKYVKGVLANYDAADYEGIINVVNGVVLNETTNVSAANFTAWVAGATAGAATTESLTGMVVTNATSILNPLSTDQIVAALSAGKFLVALNQNGTIRVEKDINSLHTFTESKRYMFSKNRVIRVLDEIGRNIRDIWETGYMGKVSADESGREMFKTSIVAYLRELEGTRAIQAVDVDAISVTAGNEIDEVIASIAVQPIDSMEILYMTVNVS